MTDSEPFYGLMMNMSFSEAGTICTINGKVVSLGDFHNATKKQSKAVAQLRDAQENLNRVVREIAEGNYD